MRFFAFMQNELAFLHELSGNAFVHVLYFNVVNRNASSFYKPARFAFAFYHLRQAERVYYL